MSKLSSAVDLLYSERREFIVIGLTGRTGSGCSTTAELLNKPFDKLLAPKPGANYSNDNEERKYGTCHTYAAVNWGIFRIIQMRDIITSFLLENKYEEFLNYIMTKEYYNPSVDTVLGELQVKYDAMNAKRLLMRENVEKDEKYLGDPAIYDFYFNTIPDFTVAIKCALDRIGPKIYISLYQDLGNNIRKSGQAFKDEFNPANIFRLSQRTNMLIKILRRKNLVERKNVLVVIDALRNPFEAAFFKDRYSSFYLFAINTEDKDRRTRLLDKGFTVEEIKRLDDIEYPEKLVSDEHFYHQNIKACLELADVHLHNPQDQGKDCNSLKLQLIRYISLIMHPGLVSPTHEERCMQIAYSAKVNAGCLSRQVGAVVTDEDYLFN